MLKKREDFWEWQGFYRKHIDKFSHLAAPLTDITRKNQPFRWTVDCQQAFEDLKNKLGTSPFLVKANLSKQFILETDASQHHVGAVLLQYDDEGLPRAVGYFSKKLKQAEWGTRFVIRTDHQPITTVFRQRTKSPRMNR